MIFLIFSYFYYSHNCCIYVEIHFRTSLVTGVDHTKTMKIYIILCDPLSLGTPYLCGRHTCTQHIFLFRFNKEPQHRPFKFLVGFPHTFQLSCSFLTWAVCKRKGGIAFYHVFQVFNSHIAPESYRSKVYIKLKIISMSSSARYD